MAHFKTTGTLAHGGVIQHIVKAETEDAAKKRMQAAYPDLQKAPSLDRLKGRELVNGKWKSKVVD